MQTILNVHIKIFFYMNYGLLSINKNYNFVQQRIKNALSPPHTSIAW